MARELQLAGITTLLLLGGMASGVAAQTTTERGASVLVFPRLVFDGGWDTVIQIANISNSEAYAYCVYVNGQLTFPGEPPGPLNPPLCTEIDFAIALSDSQPTHWTVSRGRPVDETDVRCSPEKLDCDGAGIDPGEIPPAPSSFRGELLCVEVDQAGFPLSGNRLIGQATLTHVSGADVVKYNAIGLRGSGLNDGDDVLCLGGDPSGACPIGAEYDGCPARWILNHPAEDSEDPLLGSGSLVSTRVTVVPCSQDLAFAQPGQTTLLMSVINEFEQAFSASMSVTCWADLPLSGVDASFGREVLGSDYAQTSMRAANSAAGFLVTAQVSRASGGTDPLSTSTAANLHHEDVRIQPDLIYLPPSRPQ